MTENEKKSSNQIVRLPISFDMSDARQKAAFDVLKNAGYGKRTPLIVDAILDSLKEASIAKISKENSHSEQDFKPNEEKLRKIINEAIQKAFEDYAVPDRNGEEKKPEPIKKNGERQEIDSVNDIENVALRAESADSNRGTESAKQADIIPSIDESQMNQLLAMADAFF